MPIRQSSFVRASGAALASAVSGRAPRPARVLILAGSDLAAHRLDPVGLQPLAINPGGDLNVLVSVKSDVVTAATGAASWALLNLLVDAGFRTVGLPAPLRAALVGGAVYVGDVAVSRMHDKGLVDPATA